MPQTSDRTKFPLTAPPPLRGQLVAVGWWAVFRCEYGWGPFLRSGYWCDGTGGFDWWAFGSLYFQRYTYRWKSLSRGDRGIL